MAGLRRTPITPLQVGAIKEMIANTQFNGDMATSISYNRRTDAFVATTTRGYGGLADNVNRGRTKVVSECELPALRLLEQDAPFASLAEKDESHHAESTNTARGPSPPHLSFQTMQKADKGLGLSSRSPAKNFSPRLPTRTHTSWTRNSESGTDHWVFVFLSDKVSFVVRQQRARFV